MKNFPLLSLLTCIVLSVSAQFPAHLYLEEYAEGFSAPTVIANAGDQRIFVCEQDGLIKVIDSNGDVMVEPFLDITNNVAAAGETGLIGLAFHPDYINNGWLFVTYTDRNSDLKVSRFTVSLNDPNKVDLFSEKLILEIEKDVPRNHLGGCLEFGPDGYLYISVGDIRDPIATQSLQTFKGKILRIDIDSGEPYNIPEDNPYIGADSIEEIWAMGLRNAWKFSFDRDKGDFWMCDVGLKTYEEVNFIPAGSIQACTASITGGYIYRGSNSIIRNSDAYIYGDFYSGNIYSYYSDNGSYHTEVIYQNDDILDCISAFGEDNNGELLVVNRCSGKLFRLNFDCELPELLITAPSCNSSNDGCIEIELPLNTEIQQVVIMDSLGQIIPESNYCNLPAADYSVAISNANGLCNVEYPFRIKSFEPNILVKNPTCNAKNDGGVTINFTQKVSNNMQYHKEDNQGIIIDSSDYNNLQFGRYYVRVQGAGCNEVFDFYLDSNLEPQRLELINDTIFAPEELENIQWVYNEELVTIEDMVIIPGANLNYYVPSSNGYFSIIAKDSQGCMYQGNALVSDYVSSVKAIQNPFLKIFPNPTTGTLKILNQSNDKLEIQLTTLDGAVLLTRNIHEKEKKLNLSGLTEGIYLIKASDMKGNIQIEKLIIAR